MTTWFTADTHFSHSAIITYCERPFASVEEMDAAMIANWNSLVRPRDDIWHLGDFSYGPVEVAERLLKRLAGRKHLVHGNHDRHGIRELKGWSSSQPMSEIKLDGHRITLLHYSMRVWPASNRGALHLYGHSHGGLPGDRQSCDVGVDCWDFMPVTLAEIQERLATLPERGQQRDSIEENQA